eukprot:Transcript_7076.p2 GENE.Transcript_7076~~Transcript_7076.p2  ORF type:complete len:196 (-),score=75.66 Transcript_7076:196-717(-)
MLALSLLAAGLAPQPAALRTQSLLRAQPLLRAARRAPAPQCAAAPLPLATTMQLGLDSQVVTDTILDIGVYGLLALTVILTLYSIFVTLDESNKKAGGWSKPKDELTPQDDLASGVKKNMVYNPVTNEWTSRAQSDLVDESDIGGGGGGGDGDSNRYARRMEKRQKQKQKKKR